MHCTFTQCFTSFATSIILFLNSVYTAEKHARPNVLLIMVDDLKPALGCYGHPNILTPNIDQLASQSFLFTNAFIQQALCGPSRTSLLTSRRPDTTHLYDFFSYWRKTVGNYTTLPQYFKDNGYYSISVGKIFHHGKCSGKYQDYPYSWSEIPYIPSTMKWRRKPVCPSSDGHTYENLLCAVNIQTQPEKTLPDIQNADIATDFLKNHSKHGKNPFFLGVGFYKPHVPFKFPSKYLSLYPTENINPPKDPTIPTKLPIVAWNPWTDIRQRHDISLYNISFPYGPVPDQLTLQIRQHYYASTTYMDYQLGRLLQSLVTYGLANNTVIAFLGDHGWSLGEHQEWSKYSVFDSATKIPFLIHVPWMTKNLDKTFRLIDLLHDDEKLYFQHKPNKAVRVDALVEAVDLFPTLAEIAGLKPIPQCTADTLKTILCTEGKSVAPLLKNPRLKWKNATFSQYPRPSDYPQMNSDQPKLKDIEIMGYSMRTSEYRYTEWVGFDHDKFTANWTDIHGRELYDLRSDPLEDSNVVYEKSYASQVRQLAKDLRIGWRGALPED